MKPLKHPDTVAFDKFLIDNATCVELFKGMKESDQKYLVNRLECAFMAGVRHGESRKEEGKP